MGSFLKVPKEYMTLIGEYEYKDGTAKIDYLTIMILAKIAEWENGGNQCTMKNRQFAEYFQCSESTIKRHLKQLTDLGIVVSILTKYVTDGVYRCTRVLKLGNVDKYIKRKPCSAEDCPLCPAANQ